MRCRTCRYPLWEIRERVCPECGTPFAPSQFEFVPNSVQFRCPHCGQSYYGTDERGHLNPPEFDCVTCGVRVRMDEMVLLPTEGVAEETTRPDVNPWLEGEGSWAGRWARTLVKALFSPGRFMRATPPSASTARAARFCFITNLFFAGALYGLLVLALAFPWMAGGARFASTLPGLAGVAIGVLATALVVLVLALLWGSIAHGVLRLTGPTRAGIGRTVQALCYSSACNVIAGVPCLGVYLWPFGVLWWWGNAAAMLSEGQRARPWRAIVATGVVPVVLMASLVAATAAMFVGASQVAAGAGGAMASAQRLIAPRDAYDLLLEHARAHGGRGPDHAARILVDHSPGAGAPVAWGSAGPTLLPDLRALPREQREARLKELAEAVGAGTDRPAAAHRVDDLVFMYEGVNLLAPQDSGLWVVARCADPDASAGVSVGESVTIVRADGAIVNIGADEVPDALEKQNTLRRSLGVPEVPDPRRVLHARPGPN